MSLLVNLVHLDLSKNMISCLDGLVSLNVLAYLNLSENNIGLVNEVIKLKANTALKQLSLFKNPIQISKS